MSENDRNVIFRRVRGRIIPIAVGSLAVGSALKNDRVYKIGKSKISTAKIGPITTYASSSRGSIKAVGLTKNSGKNAAKVLFVQAFETGKGFGRDILKGIGFHESSMGKSFLRGDLVSADTVRFSSSETTRFAKYFYSNRKTRLLSKASAIEHINKASKVGIKNVNWTAVSTTKIPKIRKIPSSINLKSPALLLGASLIVYGALKAGKNE